MFGFIVFLIILNVVFGVFIPWMAIMTGGLALMGIGVVLFSIGVILFGEKP